MILLDTTTRSLEFKLSGAITTNQLPCLVFWVDRTSSSITPGATRSLSNNTTAVTITAAPGASTQRKVDFINIKNNDTVSATVIVQYNDNTTIAELLRVTLSANDTLQYTDTDGWSVLDTNGQKKSLISGTVIANAGTNLNTSALALESGGNLAAVAASLSILDDWDDTDRAKVNPIAGQAGVAGGSGTTSATTQRVVLATDTTVPNVTGNIASDGADSGNPIKTGALAKTADITPVANNDRVDNIADTLGKQVVLLGSIPGLRVKGKGTFTNTTAADIIAAAGASVKIVVTSVVVTNNHATVGTKVEIRDGTTVVMQQAAPSNGGGWAINDPTGLFISTANTAVTARCVTTGADVDVFCCGYTIGN